MKLKYLVMMLLLIVCACGKDGEPGPKGDQGPQGNPGPQGDPGPTGDTGTANVMYSNWIKPDWFKSTSSNWIWHVNDENMTEEVVNRGFVLIYVRNNLNNLVFSLFLDNQFLGLPDVNLTLFLQEYRGNDPADFTIWLGAYGSASALTLLEEDFEFRYVLVPGSVLTGGRKAGFDYDDYEKTKAHFNLPD